MPRISVADNEYPEGPYWQYRGGATFVRVCESCGRFVAPYKIIFCGEEAGLADRPNARCRKCGKTKMLFVGFM